MLITAELFALININGTGILGVMEWTGSSVLEKDVRYVLELLPSEISYIGSILRCFLKIHELYDHSTLSSSVPDDCEWKTWKEWEG